jgi:hypothetical protein
MRKMQSSVDKISQEHNKNMLLAIIIAIFGVILFIALALTLPSNG